MLRVLSLALFIASSYCIVDLLPADQRSWREVREQGVVDPRQELITAHLRIGPFGPIAPHNPTSDSQSGPTGDWTPIILRPEEDKDIEVAFWGDWVLTDHLGAEIPRRDLYLHHILAYDQRNKFVTGCSSERTTWGVDHIPYPYRQIVHKGDVIKASGFHYNNMANRPMTFYVNYTMKYKVSNPADPPVRVVDAFYWMDNFNVPGTGGIGSIYTRVKNVRVPYDLVIVSMNGHMHQGGLKLEAKIVDNGEVLCMSRNLYHATEPCYWDCKDICKYTPHGWMAQWGTSTCYMERIVTKDVAIEATAYYDNSCSWRGVMAWWFSYGFSGEMFPATS